MLPSQYLSPCWSTSILLHDMDTEERGEVQIPHQGQQCGRLCDVYLLCLLLARAGGERGAMEDAARDGQEERDGTDGEES